MEVDNGYILQEVTKTGRNKLTMRPSSINSGMKVLRRAAKLSQTAELSGYSFRVGSAINLLEAGNSLEEIMLRGGSNSESTAVLHLRNLQVFP